MKAFARYLITSCILIAITSALYFSLFGLEYPEPLGPRLDPSIRLVFQRNLVEQQVQVALLGDSVLVDGIDERLLGDLIGMTSYKIGISGSASALWYLVTKNNIINSPHRPETLIIFFRGTMLTAPGFRVKGSYFAQVDEFAGPGDNLLIRLAFVNQMNWAERLATRYLPVYAARMPLRASIDRSLRYTLPALAGCDSECSDEAMSVVFGWNNLQPDVLDDAVDSAEGYLYTPERLDFERQVYRSFLPKIIQLTKRNGIRLIVVRTRTLAFPTPASEPWGLSEYFSQLETYLTQNGVVLLDFAHDERLVNKYFNDALHMSAEGREIFTRLLAEALAEIDAAATHP